MQPVQPDKQVLIDLVTTKMPFGKYKDRLICDLPVYYLEWLSSRGFPPGKLGMLLSTAFEIRTNGIGKILDTIKAAVHGKRNIT